MFRKICCVLLVAVCNLWVIGAVSAEGTAADTAENIEISARNAILFCADNGKVLYEKSADEKRPIASTTKIMTALLAFEEAAANNKEVEITQAMVRVEGSSMGLRAGNVLTLEDIARGMMMCSGNDAANALAIAISGSAEKFAEKMNARAAQLGMTNTHFVTPSGLDSPEHYSCARDLAILGAYAMENPKFFDAVSCKSLKVPFVNPDETRTYANHNRLVGLYDGCIGIKTGFTKKAGRCLVSCAQRDNVRLIAVTLNAPDDWNDHQRLFDMGFSRLESVSFNEENFEISLPLVGAQEPAIRGVASCNPRATIDKGTADKITRSVRGSNFVMAPVRQGQVIGHIVYELDGQVIATNEIKADRNIEYFAAKRGFLARIKRLFSR